MDLKTYNNSVNTYADSIFRFILKNLKDEDKTQDIVQDTFEKLWRNKDKINPEKIKSYLFTTAYHTMIDYIRKEKRNSNFEQVNEKKYSHSNQYSDLKEVLDMALTQLPDIQRSVVLLRDYEGYSYGEIAEIAELSESQVKVYIYRARKKLKAIIGTMEAVI